MSTQTETTENSLKITRTFNADVSTVYNAFTSPEAMQQWMGPGEVECLNVDINLQVGGQYRIHMKSEEGDHIAIGEYKEIVPNQKLSFSWTWENGELPVTLVTVSFTASDNQTTIELTHEGFPVQEAAEKHTEGWNACLNNLEGTL